MSHPHTSSVVRILATGGTFDKEYDEIHGTLYFRETHLSEMLDLGRSQLPVTIQKLMLIDSLEMTDDHRKTIHKACEEASENHIVITHGTDTMAQTARFLGNSASLAQKKTIVITGAMIPYKFGSSDGLFNLGSALAFAQALAPGVYVAMNGRYFHWENVEKNRKTGKFETIF